MKTIWLLMWITYFDYGAVKSIEARGYTTKAICEAAKIEFQKKPLESAASSVWCLEVEVRDK